MSHFDRRRFLQTSLVVGAAAPAYWSAASRADNAPDNRLRMATIGVGGSRGRWKQGSQNTLRAAAHADLVAVCDADSLHCNEFNDDYNTRWPDRQRVLSKHSDYRRMLAEVKPDVVFIATPDHWHVPIAIAALRSGADVYCEKPLTLTLEESAVILDAARASDRVFQVGTQQRSEWDRRFLEAAAMARVGCLGEIERVHIAVGGGPDDVAEAPKPVPEGLDWNQWLGPAQRADYTTHRQQMFRWYYDYSGGKITDWGAHHIDIALLALGKQDTGPVRVSGSGAFPPIVPERFDWAAYFRGELPAPAGSMTPTRFAIDLEFADGLHVTLHDEYHDEATDTHMPNGILFEGTKGRLMVNRGRTTGRPYETRTDEQREAIAAEMTRLYKGKTPTGDHIENFFRCVADRGEPVSDVESHTRTMECCHLANLALMLGSELEWDPVKRSVGGDPRAAVLAGRPRRVGFGLPETTEV